MLKELKLSNFRLFDNEITVRFRPITILIGKNNAGKSSIIKFLMMLKQTLEMPGKGFLVPNGNNVRLGGFYGLKSKASRKRNLGFSLTVGADSSETYDMFRFLNERGLSTDYEKLEYTVESNVTYNQRNEFLGKEQGLFFSVEKKKILETKENLSPNSDFVDFKDKWKAANEKADEQLLESLGKEIRKKIVSDIFKLEHLPTMREELRGDIATDAYISSKYVGQMGENTIFELWKERILEIENKREFLIRHCEKILGIEDIRLSEIGRIAVCEAKNAQTQKWMSITDFGFGVSQCMPVFVQSMLMAPKTQLIVEQPEAQVHPTAQIEMGSFFVELWNQHKVGSIIETHSDNILLRIRNHIKRGELLPDDISIAFFTFEGNKPVVKNLDVSDNGSMQEGLPMEFFGGNLMEILQMNKVSDE